MPFPYTALHEEAFHSEKWKPLFGHLSLNVFCNRQVVWQQSEQLLSVVLNRDNICCHYKACDTTSEKVPKLTKLMKAPIICSSRAI